MEQKKDNQNVQGAYNRHSAQGQQKDNKTNGFGYIMRKAEKLTTALYLVSDIMSDREPMKWTMRETGVEILSDVTVSSTNTASTRISDLRVVMKKIDRIIAFLDIARSTRLLSEMNASVLKKEYAGLRHDVEAEWDRIYGESRVVLTESFFAVSHTEELASGVSDVAPSVPTFPRPEPAPFIRPHAPAKEPVAPIAPKTNTTPLSPVTPMTGGKREEIENMSKEVFVHPERLPEVKPVVRPIITLRDAIAHARTDVVRDDRRKIILALIKQKPELTVKDITKSIPGVSEKTIQRELLAMVGEGILEKHGERRWSTYSLRG